MKILSPNWELLSIEDNEGLSAFANIFINFMAYYVTVVPNIAIVVRKPTTLDIINMKPFMGNFDMYIAETRIPRIEKCISSISPTDASAPVMDIVKNESTFFDSITLGKIYGPHGWIRGYGNLSVLEFVGGHLMKKREMFSVVNITILMELINERT